MNYKLIERSFGWVVLLVCILVGSVQANQQSPAWQTFELTDAEDNDIQVRALPAEGPWLVIWFVNRTSLDKGFEGVLAHLNRLGVEVWTADLLAANFLAPGNDSERSLPGTSAAAVIAEAQRRTDRKILLAAYDRMALPLLRGARVWQAATQNPDQLAGGVLFFPNLFGPLPVAGEKPGLDPILDYTSIPLVLVQPEIGALRRQSQEMLQALWNAGAPAYWFMLPEVRDYYLMREEQKEALYRQAAKATPGQILRFADLLAKTPTSGELKAEAEPEIPVYQAKELVKLDPPVQAVELNLPDLEGRTQRLSDYRGKVVMVNFWATWCPPCVEEIGTMNSLAERYKNKDFNLLSVDFRETAEHLRKFKQTVPIDYPVMLDSDGLVSEAWNVMAYPSTFILDKQGRIRHSANLALHWDSPSVWTVLDELLLEAE